MRWYHQQECKVSPNQALGREESNVWREHLKLERADALLHHPAKGSVTPLRIVEDVAYMDFHSDDEDDVG